MKIAFMDAVDLLNMGGYLDIETGQYIHPKWYSDQFFPELGLTSEDYLHFYL